MGGPSPEQRPYQRVYEDLRARIEQGELRRGAQLASQPALAAEYGVALLTVRHALELLRRGGYVCVEHGRGTFVGEPKSAGTVLVVDEDPRARSFLAQQVTLGGYRALEARDGREVLDVLRGQSVNLVFIDLRLPGLGGIELLRRARSRFPNTVYVAMSGQPDDLQALYDSDAFPITVIPKALRTDQIRRALALMHEAPSRNGTDRSSTVDGSSVQIQTATPDQINVLVVDDDAYQRALLVELLRLHSYQVREAPDGSTALEAVNEEVFTHIFLDFRMPGLGGAEVAKLIRLRDDQVVIIFLSAYPEDVVRERVGASGFGPVPVLGKPFEPADILAALRLSLAPEELLEAPRH